MLSYGMVEAKQDIYTDCIQTAPSGETYNICRMPDLRKILEFENEPLPRELATCDPDMTKCETPCEKKMREAMKAVDHLFHVKLALLADESIKDQIGRPALKLWDKVMNECVRP